MEEKPNKRILKRRLFTLSAFFIIYVLLLKNISSGRIIPLTKFPVEISSYNSNKFSDYSFKFSLDNDLSTEGHLIIQFPSQYKKFLGIREFFQKNSNNKFAKCSEICIVSENNQLKIFFKTLKAKNTPIEVQIFGVRNPSNSSGTGFFKLFTLVGKSLIDSNIFFYKLAFADGQVDLELYGFEILNQNQEIQNISKKYFGDLYSNQELSNNPNNNGFNKPIFDDSFLVLTGETNTIRFWIKEFNFEKNQEFEFLLANCQRQGILEIENFLFFDEKIEDVVIKQTYELRVFFPKNILSFESLNCKVGYFDPITIEFNLFNQRDFKCVEMIHDPISSFGNYDIVSISSFEEEDLEKIIYVEFDIKSPNFETEIYHMNVQLFNSTRKIITSSKKNIGKIKILPTILKNVSIEPIYKKNLLTTKQKDWFLIKFTLNNDIYENGKIQIEIPEKLKIINSEFFGETQSVILEKGFDEAFLNNQLRVNLKENENIIEILNLSSISADTECWIRFFAETSEYEGKIESIQIFIYNSLYSFYKNKKEQFYTYPNKNNDRIFRLSEFINKDVLLEVFANPNPIQPEDDSISKNFNSNQLMDPFLKNASFLNNLDNEVWPNIEGASSILKISFLTEFEILESFRQEYIDNSTEFSGLADQSPDKKSIIIIKINAENPFPTPKGLGFDTTKSNDIICKAIFGISAKSDDKISCGIINSKFNKVKGIFTDFNLSDNEEIIYVTGYSSIPKDTFVQIWFGNFKNFGSNIKISIDIIVREKNSLNYFLQSEQSIKVQKYDSSKI